MREPWGVNTSKEGNEQCHYNANVVDEGLRQLAALNTTFIFSAEMVPFLRELIPAAKVWIGEVESKELKLIVMLLAILVFGVFRFLKNHVRPNWVCLLWITWTVVFVLIGCSEYHGKLPGAELRGLAVGTRQSRDNSQRD